MSTPEQKNDAFGYGDGPAFPVETDGVTRYRGLSVRDYFATHAPPQPEWHFEVRMPAPRPKVVWPDLSKIDDPKGCGGNTAEVEAWDEALRVARVAQWPWVWADAVLAARKAGP